jgi:hypothetical protein
LSIGLSFLYKQFQETDFSFLVMSKQWKVPTHLGLLERAGFHHSTVKAVASREYFLLMSNIINKTKQEN